MKKPLMLGKCIDCKNPLTAKTRSKHQPGIRCLACFELFADETRDTLQNMIKNMKSQSQPGAGLA